VVLLFLSSYNRVFVTSVNATVTYFLYFYYYYYLRALSTLLFYIYNTIPLFTLTEIGGLDEDINNTGWKLLHGDVFRFPRHPYSLMLLSSMYGSGIYIYVHVCITLCCTRVHDDVPVYILYILQTIVSIISVIIIINPPPHCHLTIIIILINHQSLSIIIIHRHHRHSASRCLYVVVVVCGVG
jgi:hypothetical protein